MLGVYLGRNLSFEKHAAEVKRKVHIKCHLISRAKSLYRTSLLPHFSNFLCSHTSTTAPLYILAMFQRLSRFKWRSASIKRQYCIFKSNKRFTRKSNQSNKSIKRKKFMIIKMGIITLLIILLNLNLKMEIMYKYCLIKTKQLKKAVFKNGLQKYVFIKILQILLILLRTV